MRNAVIHQRLETSMCNFHGLAAYREHIQQDPALKPFLEALLTGFKAVMWAWCPRVQDSLIMSYKLFISIIPPQTIPDGPYLLYLHDIIFNFKKYHIIFTIGLLHTPVTVA